MAESYKLFGKFIQWHLLSTYIRVSGKEVRKVTCNSWLPDKSHFQYVFHIFQHPFTVRVSFKVIDYSTQRKFEDEFVCYCYCRSWMTWYMFIWGHIFRGVFFRDPSLINQYNAFSLQIANFCKHETSPP